MRDRAGVSISCVSMRNCRVEEVRFVIVGSAVQGQGPTWGCGLVLCLHFVAGEELLEVGVGK